MSTNADETSANFFGLIHHLLRSAGSDEPSERRGQSRNPFSVVQRIAPYDQPGFPPQGAFLGVQCHDLTQGGFSFLLPAWPEFNQLVAEFGTPRECIYVLAQVVHADQVWVYPSGRVQRMGSSPPSAGPAPKSGKGMYLVGCRFLRRIEPPTHMPRA